MINLEKIIGLTAMGGFALERLLLKRFLLGIATILLLAVIIAVLIAALLVTGIYLIYRLLVQHGLDADTAIWIVIGGTVAIIAALITYALYRLRRLRTALIPKPHLISKISNAAENVAEAFIDGFLEPSGHS